MSVRPGGFFMLPRWLGGALEDRELTPAQFQLLAFLGCRGLGHHGFSTTLDSLAATLGVSERTISRALQRLRTLDLIEYGLKQGQRTPFRITAGPDLTSDTTSDTGLESEVAQDSTSDTTSVSHVGSGEGVVRSQDEPVAQSGSGLEAVADEGTLRSHEKETTSKSTPTPKPFSNYSVGTTSEVDLVRAREDTTDNDAFLAAVDLTREEPSPFKPPAFVAGRVGEKGFVAFVKALNRYDVLNHEELLRWLALHGAVMRATEPPLDRGEGVDEDLLRHLEASLSSTAPSVELVT